MFLCFFSIVRKVFDDTLRLSLYFYFFMLLGRNSLIFERGKKIICQSKNLRAKLSNILGHRMS